ncbi:pyridoxamine 5'-phosphate oxidase family protein [Candidatus Bipolaricaulota bacterium]|nr:pyridoxamine 5'-phosphate oxidase family protein [Candidatus Bipolaricaulota bacterium]
MRRQDRQIADEGRIWEILRSAVVCRVAFCDERWPYIVPMNFGCLDGKLYFHCASAGTKLDLLRANPNVCFEVEVNVEIVPGAEACSWSVRYQSVIGLGRVSIVEELEEKRAGLKALLAQYSNADIEIPQHISETTMILRVDIESLTGKESTDV